MKEQPLKTSGADVLSSRKKTQKTFNGSGIDPPPSHTHTFVHRRLENRAALNDFVEVYIESGR